MDELSKIFARPCGDLTPYLTKLVAIDRPTGPCWAPDGGRGRGGLALELTRQRGDSMPSDLKRALINWA